MYRHYLNIRSFQFLPPIREGVMTPFDANGEYKQDREAASDAATITQ
jgi:hypothetical protein